MRYFCIFSVIILSTFSSVAEAYNTHCASLDNKVYDEEYDFIFFTLSKAYVESLGDNTYVLRNIAISDCNYIFNDKEYEEYKMKNKYRKPIKNNSIFSEVILNYFS